MVLEDRRASAIRPEPANKLTQADNEKILQTVNEPRFQSLPPTQIVPILLDEGEYIASESSFYRVMDADDQNNRRGRAKPPVKRAKPKEFVADGPNQVWTWDITYCVPGTQGFTRNLKKTGSRIYMEYHQCARGTFTSVGCV